MDAFAIEHFEQFEQFERFERFERFEHHLTSPQGRRHLPADPYTVTAGGGACCDELTFSVAVDGLTVTDAGFAADGCGAAHAAGSAAVSLVRGAPILEAARIGATEIAQELGGLSPGKLHAAELAADALARSLGAAVRDRGQLGARRHAGGDQRRRRLGGGGDVVRRRRPDGCGHARAVGRPRERRRAQLLLGDGGRAGARARPSPRSAALHDDLRDAFRQGSCSRSSTASPRARRRIHASAATARAARWDARAGAAARMRDARDRPLRADRGVR